MNKYHCIFVMAIMISCSSGYDWVKHNLNISEGLHDIEVIDDHIAIAYSYGTGNVYKTKNGGRNWNKIYQFDSIYFEQIQFFDERNGWIAGSPDKIYKTENGGEAWTEKSLKGESTEAAIYGMYFQDLDNGYISALERENKKFVSKIFKTSDGGDTWVLIHQIPEMILNLELVDGTLYGTGNNVIIKDVQNKENWEYCFQDTSKKVGQIRDLEINNANKGYAVSFNGYVIDFTEKAPVATKITKNRIRSLVSVSGDQWIAVGDKNKEDGNLYTSNDNGISWTSTFQDFPDIHRIGKSNKKLWIVGKEGFVMTRKK